MKVYDISGVAINLVNKRNQLEKELPLTKALSNQPTSIPWGEILLDISAEGRQLVLAAIESRNIATALELLTTVEQLVGELYLHLEEVLNNFVSQAWPLDSTVSLEIKQEELTQLVTELKLVPEVLEQQLAIIFDSSVEMLTPGEVNNVVNQLHIEIKLVSNLVQKLNSVMVPSYQIDNTSLSAANIHIAVPRNLALVLKQTELLGLPVYHNLSDRLIAGDNQLNITSTSVTIYLIMVLSSTLQSIYRQRLKLHSYQRLSRVIQPAGMHGEREQRQATSDFAIDLAQELIKFVTELFLCQATCFTFSTDKASLANSKIGPQAISEQIFTFIELLFAKQSYPIELIEDCIRQGFLKAANKFGGTLPQISYDTLEMIIRGKSGP